jgi:predicted Zn-dependent protease
VIRLVTLNPYEPKGLERLSKLLYAAFGVGTEHAGQIALPSGFEEPLDAVKLLKTIEGVRSYADDKLLYLTELKLKDRELISGTAPTIGFCHYNGERAIISTVGLTDSDEDAKRVARNALHQVGHLWELHHCLDPRCAMYLPWTPSFQTGEAVFCNFCREKSEQKLRLAKS